jgi:tetratricopeptide (TPR) repeat protein
VPASAEHAAVDAIAHTPAVRLFVERVRAVRPDFVLTEGNASAVGSICARLDGLPLALVLAAPRLRVLSPEALQALLDERLRLLSGGSTDAPARHRALRETIAWSVDLLTPGQRHLFGQLAVFAGGASLEAVAQVCTASDPFTALEGLEGLIDQSLVVRTERIDDEPRFGMLETIREVAWECLVASGEDTDTRRRHAHWCLELAETAEPYLVGRDQKSWLVRLESDHDNLRQALAWSVDADPTVGMGIAVCLFRFWLAGGYISEARGWLDQVLAAGTEVKSLLRAKALKVAGNLAHEQGDYASAVTRWEASLAVAQELDDKVAMASALNGLGAAAVVRGDYSRSAAYYERSLTFGDRQTMLAPLNGLAAMATDQGEYLRAAKLYEEAFVLSQELGDVLGSVVAMAHGASLALFLGDVPRWIELTERAASLSEHVDHKTVLAGVRAQLGRVAYVQGDFPRAMDLLSESLLVLREEGDRSGVALTLRVIGDVASKQGDFNRAATVYEECLALQLDLDHKYGRAVALGRVGALAVYAGRILPGLQILGATDPMLESLGARWRPPDREHTDHAIEHARLQLREDMVKGELAKGRTQTVSQAIAAAQTLVREIAGADGLPYFASASTR